MPCWPVNRYARCGAHAGHQGRIIDGTFICDRARRADPIVLVTLSPPEDYEPPDWFKALHHTPQLQLLARLPDDVEIDQDAA